MKTKYYTSLIAMFLCLAILNACDKEKDEDDDPRVEILTPTSDQMFPLNDTVWIRGNLNHGHEMHEYRVLLSNITSDSIVLDTTVSIHGHKHSEFSHYWVNSVSDHSDMMLKVTASDHEARSGEAMVHFHCHPM